MNAGGQVDAHRTMEWVARESYGRLVAYLSANTRDVASAEDALSNALVSALTTWPRDGVPQNPEAWLLTTARKEQWFARRARIRRGGPPAVDNAAGCANTFVYGEL